MGWSCANGSKGGIVWAVHLMTTDYFPLWMLTSSKWATKTLFPWDSILEAFLQRLQHKKKKKRHQSQPREQVIVSFWEVSQKDSVCGRDSLHDHAIVSVISDIFQFPLTKPMINPMTCHASSVSYSHVYSMIKVHGWIVVAYRSML